VKWEGVDVNGDAYEDSWVKKHDVTADLVLDWLKRKKGKEKTKNRRGSGSTSSRRGTSIGTPPLSNLIRSIYIYP